jgi:hypothetical protein
MYDPDHYGYYIYDNKKTYSKYDVLTHCSSLEKVKWVYNNAYFSAFDWKTEPQKNLEQLYLARAEQLREQYDYIVLMYSGGADSFNILDTFIRGNIKLDEVAHLVNYQGSRDKNNFQNKEIFDVAKPRVESLLKEKKLSTISRIVDTSLKTINHFNQKNKFDFIYTTHSFGSPNMHAKSNLYLEVDCWRKLVSDGKKVCFLWGCDKPKITAKNNKFSFYFLDIIDGAISVADQTMGNHGPIDELFYWAPTLQSAQIMIKQSHVIKNFLSVENNRARASLLKYFPNDEISARYFENGRLTCAIGGELLKKIIYPTWNSIDSVFSKSPTGNFLSARDEWFWKNTSNISTNIYLNGIQHMTETINDFWIDGSIEFMGKTYPKRIKKVRSVSYELN